MAILKVGDKHSFNLELKVLKSFAVEDDIYYLIVVLRKGTPLAHVKDPLWGVLNVDGSCTAIPEPVMERASRIVATLNLSEFE